MMNLVLSCYPLSREALRAFDGEGPPVTLTLSDLKVMPFGRMLAAVHGVRGPLLTVVVQETSERALVPLMLMLASLSRADKLQVHDLSTNAIVPVARWRALLGVLGGLRAIATGLWWALRLSLRSVALMRAAPSVFGPIVSSKALYLKSNLMLGVKAGGSIGHIAGVANELHRLDGSLLVLAPEPPPMVDTRVRFGSIPSLSTYGVPPEINHFRFNAHCLEAAAAVLGHERFDFIYQRMSLGNLAGVLLSRRYAVPLILEYNGSEVWISDNWGHKLRFRNLAERIENVCLRHAHRVVTVSEVLADELLARGVPRERIVWYPNCIDPEVFDPDRHDPARASLRARLGIAKEDLVVLFIGTFGIWHGAETLAEAARQFLADPAPPGLRRTRFVFVGDGLCQGAVRAALESEIARGDAILTGIVPQHEAPAYLAMADVFVSPHMPPKDGSKFFGSPTKLFEYMAMARPIIASDLDQIGQVLKPAVYERELDIDYRPLGDECAVLTEPGSAAAIVRALHVLSSRPDLCESLALAARRRVLAHYTWHQHVDALMRTLR